jgi:4-hydroxyphenylpyruvate dioxygenase-like putative hemolysin
MSKLCDKAAFFSPLRTLDARIILHNTGYTTKQLRSSATACLFDKPMGFEFVEFASPHSGVLEPVFEHMGYSLVAHHRSKDVYLYRQG